MVHRPFSSNVFLVACAWSLAACSGEIDGAGAKPGAMAGNNKPRGGAGGAPAEGSGMGAQNTKPGACPGTPKPSRLTVHRLNRTEYDNTVRDLLGDATRPAQSFSADDVDVEGGFDNNAEVLSVNSQLLGDWMTAAQRLAQAAVLSPKFVTCTPGPTVSSADCAKQILAPLARRAWRRSVTADEIADLQATAKLAETQGDPFTKGIELALRRILVSPRFVFRFEMLADPLSPRAQALDGFSLASRLSYFLWRSMPDDALLAAAEAGKLADPRELESQVVRMLADTKSAALIQDLARQWLLGQAAEIAVPDPVLYRMFDPALRKGLQSETSLFLGEFINKNLNLLDLLDADFSFMNARVARHYGVTGVTGVNFQRVSLAGNAQRGGLLTQGNMYLGIMTDPKVTSIENRGVWVLERLLCGDLPPPPPDATEKQIELVSRLGPTATKRQIAAERNAMAGCGACHSLFDPIGFALENYDVIGAWRAMDRARPVDARGELPGLGAFNGPKELSAALKKDPRLPDCLAEVVSTFALGRSLGAADRCTISSIAGQAATKGFGAGELIKAVAASPAFRTQSGEPN